MASQAEESPKEQDEPGVGPERVKKLNTDLNKLDLMRKETQSIRQQFRKNRNCIGLSLERSKTLPPLSLNDKDIQTSIIQTGQKRFRKQAQSPQQYWTSTKRAEKTPETYDALVRNFAPIPRLFDSFQQEKKHFKMRSLEGWKNEVKKVVPQRPAFAISSDWVAPPADWDDRDHYIYSPRSMFYKNTKYIPHKDYTVNPEWISESMKVSIFSPAYRTCALRYGWCS